MSAHCETLTITVTDYTPITAPDVTFPFEPLNVTVVNEDAAAIVLVSFDGQRDAGRLNPAAARGFTWVARQGTQVWLKLAVAGSAVVTVMAEK